MASTLNDLITLKAYLEKEVCSKVSFKVPDDDMEDEAYVLQKAHPKVYLMENPDMAAPSITIKLLSTEEDRVSEIRSMLIQLLVVTWNPGIHSQELYYRKGPMYFETDDEPNEFIETLDGWAESMYFTDLINTALMDRLHIGDELEVDQEEPMQIVPLRPETNDIDLQNYFVQVMEFTVKRYIRRPKKDIQAYERIGKFTYEEKRKGL